MTKPFFPDTPPIRYAGPDSSRELVYRHYEAERLVAGKSMRDHLRIAVCYWHSFAAPGSDVFGAGSFDRPWLAPGGDPMAQADAKLACAFEFFEKLGTPFFCFHDRDLAPEGATLAESNANLDRLVDRALAEMERTRVQLLWGTANLFSHPRYAAGAATNPDPEVFAYAAAQVAQMLEVTQRMKGANYVLWGGREGYETLLNTDLAREADQLGRFMNLVVEHKHRIGFEGTILIEPKPHEPTKHQYDHDASAVHAFLQKYGLQSEIKLNIEVNHATLAGHSFQHELAYAATNELLGSVDINRGDPQNGWDTDQFPNSTEELCLAVYEILRAGGIGRGGFNFDARLRRQSIDRADLFHAHVGGIDVLARALVVASKLLEGGELRDAVERRYRDWDGGLGRGIEGGEFSLADLADEVLGKGLDPKPRSGRQERIENLVNRYL